MREVERLSIHEIVRRTGHDRNTVRRALRREGPPRYRRPPRPSMLDPFKEDIHGLLQQDARIPGKRVRELIEQLGYEGSKTILDDYLREVRPLFERRRTYQRTIYRPGELLQFDLWEPRAEIHAGGGQPTDAFAGFCGALRVGWLILEARDPEAKGALERSHRFMRTNFEPGRSFANELDYQLQLDAWCDKVNARIHRTLRCRPT